MIVSFVIVLNVKAVLVLVVLMVDVVLVVVILVADVVLAVFVVVAAVVVLVVFVFPSSSLSWLSWSRRSCGPCDHGDLLVLVVLLWSSW